MRKNKMKILFRNYQNNTRFSNDYFNVWRFLKHLNEKEMNNPLFTWGRWDWFISRPSDQEERRSDIGIWEDQGKIVALATFEGKLNEVYLSIDNNYSFLGREIIDYCIKTFMINKELNVFVDDNNLEFIKTLEVMGFKPTNNKEYVYEIDFKTPFVINLCPDYQLFSMSEMIDYEKYNSVMWKGFNHPGKATQTEEEVNFRKTMLSSPNLNRDLTIFVKDRLGDYLAHAGIWYHESDSVAYIEPVATIPEARRKGLAKACIYYGLNKAYKLGARKAIVGSSQEFYKKIGFKKHSSYTSWSYKSK